MKNYSCYIRKGSVWVLSLHCQSERLTAQRKDDAGYSLIRMKNIVNRNANGLIYK